jgi:hypothetical protein
MRIQIYFKKLGLLAVDAGGRRQVAVLPSLTEKNGRQICRGKYVTASSPTKNEKRSQTEKNVLLYDFNHWGIQYQPTLLGTADGPPLKLYEYEIFGLTFLH